MELFEVPIYDDDFIKMVGRYAINLIVVSILVRFVYYRRSRSKDYLFTFYVLSTVVFFICFTLKKLDIDTGMGLGLFAIFGVLRYRTDTMPIREMSYLFTVIGIAVINSLSNLKVSWAELACANMALVALPSCLEMMPLLRQEAQEEVLYEKLDLVHPDRYGELLADLEERTGLAISRIEIGKIDLVRDCATITLFYHPHQQTVQETEGISITRRGRRL
ncbi:DUF4956 domain-containing protein [Aeoliella mucimassa]|uniref:DUF4956 domain-containing protein n=1 Tax=Aeoliella mucimassa TaxID=2527972 RepID=A0A518AJ74_9BACT|nr:DUF4956 domain-containing protein [Aeoliella mucimassa]QDU54750.1 hypothetical protein Pan181_09330 [Aeoliella mucimassa]